MASAPARWLRQYAADWPNNRSLRPDSGPSLLQVSAALATGVMAFYAWPAAGFAMLLLLLPLAAYLTLSRPRQTARWLIVAFLLAAGWAALNSWQRLAPRIDERAIGQTVAVQGRVVTIPERQNDALRFMLRVESSAAAALVSKGALLRLSWYRPTALPKAGELWQLPLRLKPPRGMVNFYGFDYERWLYQLGVHGTGYIRGEPIRLAAAAGHSPITRLRAHLLGKLASAAEPAASQGMGLLRALTLGDRSGLNDDDWSTLRRTGTSHLVAISGLHIGLVAGLVFLLARLLWARTGQFAEHIAAPRAAALCAIVAAAGYAALAGFSLPTQRALIMLLVAMLALWSRSTLQPAAGWWLALAAVLLWSPSSVLSGGFWLSFLAVGWILYWLTGRRPPPSGWRLLLQIQLLLAVGLWPVTLYFFGTASLTAPLVNLVAVPVVSFVLVPLALACIVVLPFSAAPAALFAGLLQRCWNALDAVAALPMSQWQLTPPLWVVVIAIASALLLTLPKSVPGRWAGIPGLCLLLLWQPSRVAEQQLRLTQLDVGQGLAVLLQTRDHALLFDGGARYAGGFDLGERIVLPELQARGIERLDAVIASHGDNDHRGGLPAVLAAVEATRVLAGGRDVPRWQLNQRPCVAGQQWNWNGVQFSIVWPSAAAYSQDYSENDLSCVLLVEVAGLRLLLTGDIEYPVEQQLMASYPNLSADVVQVPHHGSRSSSAAAFVQQLKPKLALLSAGYKNRFGHPHSRVLARYAATNAELRRTDLHGAVSVTLSANGIEVTTARQRRPGWWR